MVGGVYAAGYSAVQIESLALNADWNLLFSSSVPFGAQYLPERQQAQRYAIQLRHKNLLPYLPGGLVPLQNVEFLLMRLASPYQAGEHRTADAPGRIYPRFTIDDPRASVVLVVYPLSELRNMKRQQADGGPRRLRLPQVRTLV